MIRCNVNKNIGLIKVKVKGTGQDLTSEVSVIIHEVYQGIKQTSPEAADIFKRCIIAAAIDPKSPVWNRP